ncbi:MAG: 4Fe-4S dicluster domain-containing protein [Planctomycetes bacterium]|nr:4Fe-4S dicluster domain-containing protein [Planctomycetota bacterium]
MLEQFKTGQATDIAKAYAKLDPNPGVCTECGDCVERCPYSLPIPEKMKELAELAEK